MVLNVRCLRDVRKNRRVRVWLDGEEVTDRCFYADGRRGVVRLFRHDAQGKVMFGGDAALTEERRGRVRWRFTSGPSLFAYRFEGDGKRSRRANWRLGRKMLLAIKRIHESSSFLEWRDRLRAIPKAELEGRR